MMKNYLASGIILSILFYSCSSDIEPIGKDSIEINTNTEVLSLRISKEGSGVIGITDPTLASSRISEDEIPASELPLILLSKVEAPVVDDHTLKATHVDIDGDYAYVSYNTEGDTYLGGIEIFDISDAYNPKITSQAILKDIDISSVAFKDGKLHLAAAVNLDAEYNVTSPANLITVSVAGGLFTSDFSFASVPGYVATDVAHTSSSTVLTTGNDGVVGLFDGNSTLETSIEVGDLRAASFGSEKLAVLSGSEGVIVMDPISLTASYSIPLALEVSGAKRTIEINNDHLFVSEGKNGAGIYQLSDGSLVKKLAIPIIPTDVEEGDIVTNAVSVDNDLLFMANGAAGISISDVQDMNEIKEFGVLDLDGSSNFVRNEEKFVFVATGAGGLQILKINTVEEETPEDTGIDCEGLPSYTGSQNLNVNSNDSKAYSGSAVLKTANINSDFLFCGSLAIEQNLNINSNGFMTVSGSFAFGQYQKNTSLNINGQSTLQLHGSAVIYGDLRLNSGATLEFVGDDNTITVYGTVTLNGDAKIIGNYTDTEGKLK